jgi:hypothetical protein
LFEVYLFEWFIYLKENTCFIIKGLFNFKISIFFRHIILCGSQYFNEALWDIVCLALCRATQVSFTISVIEIKGPNGSQWFCQSMFLKLMFWLLMTYNSMFLGRVEKMGQIKQQKTNKLI